MGLTAAVQRRQKTCCGSSRRLGGPFNQRVEVQILKLHFYSVRRAVQTSGTGAVQLTLYHMGDNGNKFSLMCISDDHLSASVISRASAGLSRMSGEVSGTSCTAVPTADHNSVGTRTNTSCCFCGQGVVRYYVTTRSPCTVTSRSVTLPQE